MKFLRVLSSALALHLAEAYLVSPPGTPAPGAAADCSAWVEKSYGLTCEIIQRFYGMSRAQFEKWNPGVGDDCSMIEGLYYCVQVNFNTQTPTVTLTSSPTDTTTSGDDTTTPTTPPTTATTSGDGTGAPTPTQTGIASNCNKFYEVVDKDTCYDIADAQGITLDDFYAWNPAVGSSCGGLQSEYYVCVGVASGGSPTTQPTLTTSTTSSGNGVSTPTPTQTGMVGRCDEFYFVVEGDGCYDIADAAEVPLDDFYSWNPAVGDDCAALWPDYYVCTGIL